MPRDSAVKNLIIELARGGMGPEKIMAELAKRGTPRKLGYIKKVISIARKKDPSIPNFNTASEKEIAKAEKEARRSALPSPRIKERRKVARLCLAGYEPEEIIANGYCPQVDFKEILDICSTLKGYRGAAAYLVDLKVRNVISQNATSFIGATNELESKFFKMREQKESAEGRAKDAEGRADGLRTELERQNQMAEGLRTELCNQIEGLKKEIGSLTKKGEALTMCVPILERLYTRYGGPRLWVLLKRVDSIEIYEEKLKAVKQELREETTAVNEIFSQKEKEDLAKIELALNMRGLPRDSVESLDRLLEKIRQHPVLLSDLIFRAGRDRLYEALLCQPSWALKDLPLLAERAFEAALIKEERAKFEV